MNILDEILAHKAVEVAQRKTLVSEDELRSQISGQPEPRGFLANIENALRNDQASVIAEIKKASPSKGVIRPDFNPPELAKSYLAGGATCISVLTDEKYFQGHDEYLKQVKLAVDLPIIRKDFIVDTYQIYESRLLGADAILLIVAALSETKLAEFYALAISLKMDVLVEVHDKVELQAALALGARLVGVNNRNLKTFVTDLNTSVRLRAFIPDDVVMVAESAIGNAQDVEHLRKNGVHVFLVGESLMRKTDPGVALKQLLGTN